MCAIFGLGFQKGNYIKNNVLIRTVLRKLFFENMSRGRTAAGLALVSATDIAVLKTDVDGEQLTKLPEYDKAEDKYLHFGTIPTDKLPNVNTVSPISVIGHCRLKTKGTEKDNRNNHPIITGRVVGAHNGIVSNDDHLFHHYSEQFKRIGRVDSEIIFALINHFVTGGAPIAESIQKTVRIISGSFACAMVHNMQPHVVWLFRNNQPCTIRHYEELGIIIWSSITGFIQNATSDCNIGDYKIITFPQHSGIAIDLYRNKIHQFELQQPHTVGHVY